MLQGEILHYVQAPQLLTHILHSQALRHGLRFEGEGDVGAAVVLVTGAGVAFGGTRGRVGAPALSKAGAGLHKAVALPDGDAALA